MTAHSRLSCETETTRCCLSTSNRGVMTARYWVVRLVRSTVLRVQAMGGEPIASLVSTVPACATLHRKPVPIFILRLRPSGRPAASSRQARPDDPWPSEPAQRLARRRICRPNPPHQRPALCGAVVWADAATRPETLADIAALRALADFHVAFRKRGCWHAHSHAYFQKTTLQRPQSRF